MNSPIGPGSGGARSDVTVRAIASGGAIAVAALISFFLPFGWLFGSALLVLAVVYAVCVATGMNPSADARTTAGHVRRTASTLGGAAPGEPRMPQPPVPPPASGPPPAASPPPVSAPTDPRLPTADAPEPAPGPAPVASPPPVPPVAAPSPPPPTESLRARQAPPAPPPPPSEGPPPVPVPQQSVPTQPDPGVVPPAQVPSWTSGPPGPQRATAPPYPPPYPMYGPPPDGLPPRRSGRGLLWSALAMATVVMIAVATVAVVLVIRSDDTTGAAGALPPEMLQSAFPDAPTRTFAVTGDTYGSSGTFQRPNYPIGGEETTGYLKSEKYAITGIAGGLIAIDPATGEVAWIQDTRGHLQCSDVFDDQTIACMSEGGLVLLSADTGEVVQEVPHSGYPVMKKFGSKYAYASRDGDIATVSLGTLDDPEKFWVREVVIEGGTRTELTVSDAVVMFRDHSATGGWALAYNESGDALNPDPANYGNLVGDLFVSVDYPAKVYDAAGGLQYTAGTYVDRPSPYAPVPGVDLAFTGGSVIDSRDGREVWDFPEGAPPTDRLHADIRAVVGTVVLANTWPRGGLLAADARTGALLWRIDAGVPTGALTTDGQRVMAIDDYGTVTAYDLATGAVAWEVEAGDLGSYPKLFSVGDHLVAVGSDAMVGFSGSGGPAVLYDSEASTTATQKQSGGAVTKCGSAPKVVPETFRAVDGALLVRLKFTATCPGGDVVSNSGYRITIRDQSSLIASAQFNLGGSSVLALPGDSGSVSRDFMFLPGTFWRLPASLDGGGGSSTSASGGGQTVECTTEGSDTVAPGTEVSPSTGSSESPLTGAQTQARGGVINTTQNALDALRAQANADLPLVHRDLAERWLAQISAKQVRTPPMTAVDIDDTTMVAWTPEEILRQHLALRSRYPEVRLVYSDEWRTFDLRGWWITVAQPNVLDAISANAWCDSKALAPNQCFAKLISNTRGSEGTTMYRR